VYLRRMHHHSAAEITWQIINPLGIGTALSYSASLGVEICGLSGRGLR
jgi:hypothetical protein